MSTVYLIAFGLLITCSYHEAASDEDEIDDEVIIFETTISNVSYFRMQNEIRPLYMSFCPDNSTECVPTNSCLSFQPSPVPPTCGWGTDGRLFVCCPADDVSYPFYTYPCPEHRPHCVNLTSCNTVRRDMRLGMKARHCGWATGDGAHPLVCCPGDEEEEIPAQSVEANPLRPQVCGMLQIPGLLGSVPRQEEIIPDFEIPANNTNLSCNTNYKSASIIGGKDSVLGAWPWMAGVYSTNFTFEFTYFSCGAAIISQFYLVTAAQCFNYSYDGIPPSTHYILAGSNKFLQGTHYFIRKITVHPDFIPGEIHDDIAVIRLLEPIQFGTNIQPICLPTSSEMQAMELTGRNVTLIGWGFKKVANDSAPTPILKEATVQVMDAATCNKTYRQVLCAAVPEGGTGPCTADEGGPLMLFENGTWVMVGVVSHADEGCAEPGDPGIYTRVTAYIDWLREVTAYTPFIRRRT